MNIQKAETAQLSLLDDQSQEITVAAGASEPSKRAKSTDVLALTFVRDPFAKNESSPACGLAGSGDAAPKSCNDKHGTILDNKTTSGHPRKKISGRSPSLSEGRKSSNKVQRRYRKKYSEFCATQKEEQFATAVKDRVSLADSDVQFLSVDRVARRYDVSVASIWRWVAAGQFPSPRKLTTGTTRWALADILEFDQSSGRM